MQPPAASAAASLTRCGAATRADTAGRAANSGGKASAQTRWAQLLFRRALRSSRRSAAMDCGPRQVLDAGPAEEVSLGVRAKRNRKSKNRCCTVSPALTLRRCSRADDHHGSAVRRRRGAGRGLAHLQRCASPTGRAVAFAGRPRCARRLACACRPRATRLRLTRRLPRRAGTYIANRVADKISMLADNVYICRSGSVRTGCRRQQREAAAASAVVLATEAALQARAVQP